MAALRRRREREDSGTCLVEGYEELALAMDAGAIPEVVLHCAELMLDPAAQLPLVEREILRELKRLRRENEVLRQEREFLKRATAFFAKEGSR